MGRDLLLVKKLSATAILPARGSALAAGFDLASAYDCVIPAHGKALVKTDIAIAIPSGCYARVAPRSGLSWKNHLDVGAGVIDEDYRGNVGVVIFNHANEDFQVKHGDRIAQLILERIISQADVKEVDELSETSRGESGFGSTGVAKRAKVEPTSGKNVGGVEAVLEAITAIEADLTEAQRNRLKEIAVQADDRRFDLFEQASSQFFTSQNKASFLEWVYALLK
ncbi:deoxyuridine 5'-triphosphate nucleotidohydrolase [Thraustotheca clavata]|uniref:Deoxyuridine 5'-triphosphate nucleotidohydrolase n=1 Tax=Thraustotheca clavata TaxID=74557 RepID=A0A1W0AAZ7_9STRA|nr:deoxyuridine 5'-triphosphate nucleotidohydrolase [Thraustotheca clavata]